MLFIEFKNIINFFGGIKMFDYRQYKRGYFMPPV